MRGNVIKFDFASNEYIVWKDTAEHVLLTI